MSNQNNNQKTYYTDLYMKQCVSKDGDPFVGITVKGRVSRPTPPRTVGDNLVIEFSIPINKRGKSIEYMCGKAPYERNETVWANVSFWQDAAATDGPVTRLDQLFCQTQGKGVTLIVTGSIKVEENKGKDGRVFVNTNIYGDAFCQVFPDEENPLGRNSFIHMMPYIGKDGKGRVLATAEVTVSNVERRDNDDGSSVLNFKSSLRGVSKQIERMCGMAPYTSHGNITQVKCAFWENTGDKWKVATRLENMLRKSPDKTFVLAVTGEIKVQQQKDEQGKVFIDTSISCWEFSVIRSFAKSNQQKNSYDQSGQQSQGYGQAAPQQESIPSGFGSDYYEVDDDDDELPF